MYGEWIYFTTPDAHLLSLNAKDGKVRWDVVLADSTKGYWSTMSPLIVGNHVIAGVSGDFDNLQGFLKAFDPETGKLQCRSGSSAPVDTPYPTTGGLTWMTYTSNPPPNTIFSATA